MSIIEMQTKTRPRRKSDVEAFMSDDSAELGGFRYRPMQNELATELDLELGINGEEGEGIGKKDDSDQGYDGVISMMVPRIHAAWYGAQIFLRFLLPIIIYVYIINESFNIY